MKVTAKTVNMLNAMPKLYGKSIFVQSVKRIQGPFALSRLKLANKLGNPRLLQIHFHTLRHWRGRMEYHRTLDPLGVQKMLGHKSIENTLIYMRGAEGEGEEYNHARAKTREEEDVLIDGGWQFIRYDNEYKEAVYRKRK